MLNKAMLCGGSEKRIPVYIKKMWSKPHTFYDRRGGEDPIRGEFLWLSLAIPVQGGMYEFEVGFGSDCGYSKYDSFDSKGVDNPSLLGKQAYEVRFPFLNLNFNLRVEPDGEIEMWKGEWRFYDGDLVYKELQKWKANGQQGTPFARVAK